MFSNLFIGLVAVLMAWETSFLFVQPISSKFYLFLFSLTTGVYAVYSILDTRALIFPFQSERSNWNYTHRIWLFVVAAACFTIIFCLFTYFFSLWFWFLPSAVGTVFYFTRTSSKWQRTISWPYAKTTLLSFVWVYATFLIPHGVAGEIIQIRTIYLGMISWMPIFSICLLFDLRDDEPSVTLWGEQLINRLLGFFLLISLVFFVQSNNSFAQYYIGSKILLLIILRLSSRHSLTTQSPIWYYGVLDGAMGFPLARMLSYLF